MQLIFFFFSLVLNNSVSHASCIGINCTCTTSATAVAFGAYNPLSATTINTTGNVAVTCSALIAGLNVSYVIALNAGLNGTFAARSMTSGGATLLQYNLYTSSADSTIWGDGTSGTSTVSDSYLLSLLSVTRNYTVYANLPMSQNVSPGSYSDTITVTVTY